METLRFRFDTSKIREGHTVQVGSHSLRVVHVAPYTHPTLDGAFGMAHLSDGSTISLWRGQTLPVWS